MGGFIFEHGTLKKTLTSLASRYIPTVFIEGWMFVKFYAVTSSIFFLDDPKEG